jgi:hypothetical protein
MRITGFTVGERSHLRSREHALHPSLKIKGAEIIVVNTPTGRIASQVVANFLAAKIIAPALNTLVRGPSKLYEDSRGQIRGAIDALAKRAIQSGDIRSDLDPFDLLRALIGVSDVASSPDWQQSAKRLVDILITGSRPAK